MRKILSALIAVLLVIGCVTPAALAATVSSFYDFQEGILSGDVFTTRDGGSWTMVKGTDNENYVALKNGIGQISDNKKWLATYDAVYVQADIKSEASGVFTCLATQQTSAHTPLVVLDNGKIKIGQAEVGSYSAGVWYEMTAVLYPKQGKLDLWFDGVQLADDTSITMSYGDKALLAFKATTASAYLDNITISNDTSAVPVDPSLKIISSTPADGAKPVISGSSMSVSVTFNYPIKESTLDGAISIDGGANIGGVSLDGSKKVLTIHVSDVIYDTCYTLTFDGTIEGTDGQMFDKFNKKDVTLSFTPAQVSRYSFDIADSEDLSGVTTYDGTIAAYNDGSDYSLGLYGGKKNAAAYLTDSNMWINKKSTIYFKANIKADEGTLFNFFATKRYSAQNYDIAAFSDGSIVLGGKKVGEYTPGQWYEVMIYIYKNDSGALASLWIDDKCVAEGVSVPFGQNDDKSCILFRATGGMAYIDDIVLGDAPAALEKVALGNFMLLGENGEIDDVQIGKLTANLRYVNGSKKEEKAILIIALYDKAGNISELESVNISEVSSIASNTAVTLSAYVTAEKNENRYVKVFLWESEAGMKPILVSETR